MISKVVLKEIKRIGICTAILTAIMLALFFAMGKFNTSVLYGALLGFFVNYFNFIVMAIAVERSVSNTKTKASSMMGLNYFFRLLVIGVAVYFAIKSPYINYITAVIPLIFTRISVYILNFLNIGGDKS